MKKIGLGFVCLLVACLASGAAHAERALSQHFGESDSCYAREYTAKHMAKNPQQTVLFIQFKHHPNWFRNRNIKLQAGAVPFSIEVFFKNDSHGYTNSGECRPLNKTLNCQIECDGGGFILKHKDADSILLYTRPGQGFAVAGCDADGYRAVTDKTDDKIFLLHRLPTKECTYPD